MLLNPELVQRVKEFLAGRKGAYCRLFSRQNRDAVAVLEDLAAFCRANETTFHGDPRAHALAEGRREVWLRIQQHLQLDDETLWALYRPRNAKGDA